MGDQQDAYLEEEPITMRVRAFDGTPHEVYGPRSLVLARVAEITADPVALACPEIGDHPELEALPVPTRPSVDAPLWVLIRYLVRGWWRRFRGLPPDRARDSKGRFAAPLKASEDKAKTMSEWLRGLSVEDYSLLWNDPLIGLTLREAKKVLAARKFDQEIRHRDPTELCFGEVARRDQMSAQAADIIRKGVRRQQKEEARAEKRLKGV